MGTQRRPVPRRAATREAQSLRHRTWRTRPNTTPRASRTRVPASRTRCPGSTGCTRPARNTERGPRAVRGRGVLDRELPRTDHHRVGVLSARAVALPAGASVSVRYANEIRARDAVRRRDATAAAAVRTGAAVRTSDARGHDAAAERRHRGG